VIGFDLTAIASIGSAVALLIFVMITVAHLRVREETGASLIMLVLAIVTASVAFLTFLFTTLRDEPTSLVALVVFIVLSIGADLLWKRVRNGQGGAGGHPSPIEQISG
jgi:hypothetical protein